MLIFVNYSTIYMRIFLILTLSVFSLFTSAQRVDVNKKQVRQTSRESRKDIRVVRRDIREIAKERRNISGEIQLSGAFALYPLAVRWAEEFKKLYPNVKIDISAGGAGKGITDALTNMVDLGMVSRDIHQVEINNGALAFTVAKDAVVATINSRNPIIRDILFHGLQQKRAYALWHNQTIKTWGALIGSKHNIPVHAYTRSDACGAAETWASWLGIHQENLEGTAVYGDPGVASVVQRDKIAISFNNLAYAYDIKTRRPYRGIMVMPLDLNNNGRVDLDENFYSTADMLIDAIEKDKYPSPPARSLYLVSNGKPSSEVVLLFLEFILTEGQKYNKETLFIPLSPEQIDNELTKLN